MWRLWRGRRLHAGRGCACHGRRSHAADPRAGPWDWPTYGHDAQHTFAGRTTLTEETVPSLAVAWFFRTGDAVTATPTVVDGTVYVGSWDDNFYALDLETGKVRWKYRLSDQNAVTPYPGQHHRPISSDGGLVTSSAWYQPGDGHRPDLVIFGGGYTLYALNASTGALYWRHDYTGRPGHRPDPNSDGTRIFSSPVVVGDKVLFGTDVDGQKRRAGLRGGRRSGYRGSGVGVPDRRQRRRASAEQRLWQRVVIGIGAAAPRPGRL